jgi:hypothetical protein
MAIEEYVQTSGTLATASKAEVFRFIEIQFARADANHDGLLDIDELALFVRSLSHPQADPR